MAAAGDPADDERAGPRGGPVRPAGRHGDGAAQTRVGAASRGLTEPSNG